MPDPEQTSAPQRPDLEESTNVAKSHGTVLRDLSAANREKRIREDGMEPVSLWIVLGGAFVLLVAGGVLGAGGGLFDYDELRTDGYVRAAAPGGMDDVVLTAPILTALSKNGAKVYAKCNGCHQSSGMGDGAQYPPLGGSEWVTGDTDALAMIILNGVKGEIEVAGKTWNSQMPAQGPMNALELASVMTYIRNSFGNKTGDVVTPEMAAAAIEISKERAGGAPIGLQTTVAELKEKHSRMLPGDPMDPATIVDLETLEPVEEPEAAN
jgi:mono/diheme cytochrome c family protein